jgi:hypothetical protein
MDASGPKYTIEAVRQVLSTVKLEAMAPRIHDDIQNLFGDRQSIAFTGLSRASPGGCHGGRRRRPIQPILTILLTFVYEPSIASSLAWYGSSSRGSGDRGTV